MLCARCWRSVAPDTDHIHVQLGKKRMQVRNDTVSSEEVRQRLGLDN